LVLLLKYATYPSITPVMQIDENIGARVLNISEVRTGGVIPTITIRESDIILPEKEETNVATNLN
jgi:hypothetical protein